MFLGLRRFDNKSVNSWSIYSKSNKTNFELPYIIMKPRNLGRKKCLLKVQR